VLELLGVDDLLPTNSAHKRRKSQNFKMSEVSIDESLDNAAGILG
jgi:hypothetical protein